MSRLSPRNMLSSMRSSLEKRDQVVEYRVHFDLSRGAAVDTYSRPADKCRIGTGKEQRDLGDVNRLAKAAGRRSGDTRVSEARVLAKRFATDGRHDAAGLDIGRCYPELAGFGTKRPGQWLRDPAPHARSRLVRRPQTSCAEIRC